MIKDDSFLIVFGLWGGPTSRSVIGLEVSCLGDVSGVDVENFDVRLD